MPVRLFRLAWSVFVFGMAVAPRVEASRLQTESTVPLGPNATLADISDPKLEKTILSDFKRNIEWVNPVAHIESCDYEVTYTDGKGGGVTYGAICRVNVGKTISPFLMCDDFLLGEFTMKLSGFSLSRKSVVDFVMKSCPG